MHILLVLSIITCTAAYIYNNDDRVINGSYNFDTLFCNIDRIEAADLSHADFLQTYHNKLPIIVRHASNNEAFIKRTYKNNIMTKFGDLGIVLASANSYSHRKYLVMIGVGTDRVFYFQKSRKAT